MRKKIKTVAEMVAVITSTINWKLTLGLMIVPIISEAFDSFLSREQFFAGLGDYTRVAFEMLVLACISVYISYQVEREKKSENELRRTESKYRVLVEQIPAVTYVAAPDERSTVLYISPQIKKLLGYSQTEYKTAPHSWRKILHPEDRERVMAELSQCRASLKKFISEYRMIHRAGHEVWFRDEAEIVRSESGKPMFLHGVMLDITERKKAEQALGASEAKYRELVENANSIILRMDTKGNITFFNEFAQTFFGYEESEILGKNVIGAIVPKTDTFGHHLTRMIRDIGRYPERYINNENENMRRNGERVWIAWANKPIFDENGDVVEILCIGNNITKRKQAEEELKKTKEDLEEKNKRLTDLDRVKSEFISIVSHELRTPLTVVREAVSQVLDGMHGKITQMQKEFLLMAISDIDRLGRIIGELLDVSKIEAGKVELRRGLFNIVGLTKKVVSGFSARAKDKGIEIKEKFPKDDIEIFADKDKFIQVFTNLIDNALKFTQKGNVTVSIEDEENEVKCAVSDTGKGISKYDLPNIFKRFQQANRLQRYVGQGAGLGLTIAKGIIDLHKGRIWVESEEQKGSRFTFTLPKFGSGLIFNEYVTDGIRSAMNKCSRVSLIVVSLFDFEEVKMRLSAAKLNSIMRDMAEILEGSLRQTGDAVLEDSGEIIVILTECGKQGARQVEGRAEGLLKSYLTKKKLTKDIRLKFGFATYPDEVRSDAELIEKSRQSRK